MSIKAVFKEERNPNPKPQASIIKPLPKLEAKRLSLMYPVSLLEKIPKKFLKVLVSSFFCKLLSSQGYDWI